MPGIQTELPWASGCDEFSGYRSLAAKVLEGAWRDEIRNAMNLRAMKQPPEVSPFWRRDSTVLHLWAGWLGLDVGQLATRAERLHSNPRFCFYESRRLQSVDHSRALPLHRVAS